MTGRELLKKLEDAHALDFELMMNVNMEPIPVKNAIVVYRWQLNGVVDAEAVVKNIVIFDN